MTKRKYKEERKKLLRKYSLPMSEIPDNELKDSNGCWIWLSDFVDYKRQGQKGSVLSQIKVEYRIYLYNTVECLRKSRGVRNWNY